MANKLTTGSSTDNIAQVTTAQIQPSPSALVLVFVANLRGPLSFGTLATPAVSGCGLTWEPVTSVLTSDNDIRLTCFRALGAAPTRSTLVIDFADQVQDSCAWSVFEYADVDTSGVNGAGAIGLSRTSTATDTKLTTSAPPIDATRDRTVGAVILAPSDGQAHAVSPGAGLTEIHEQTPTQLLARSLALQTEEGAIGANSCSWSWTGNISAAAVALSIKGKPATTGTPTSTGNPSEDLIRRFEPILHLHPGESFVPVNAKRYVENAALWAATAPFDAQASWGATPLAKAGTLSAVPGEPGKFLGTANFIVADATRERFLELGGWKNADQGHEPDTAAGNTNLYADRKAIFDAYQGSLKDSRFWYHAEVFDSARLARLAATVPAPALSQTVTNIKNPALLCYYLFYPAHEESVDQNGCPNVEAKELACHAGDWQCIALLLEGDGTTAAENYTPKFFGITGTRPAPVRKDGAETYRPYAFDADGRVAMKVEPWRAGSTTTTVQPDVVGDHPRFYVARGSHSMYTVAGDHEVAPYDDATTPFGCGKFDTPSAIPPPPAPPGGLSTGEEATLIAIVKTVIGGILHALALGYIAGLIEAVVHTAKPFGAADTPPTADTPNPDAAPVTPGAGTTVRPNDLAVDGVTSGLVKWECGQGIQAADGRHYDFIVDRGAQVWWPSDDGTAGFRGRWGQRVTADPLPRRAGVHFPEFWKMFLTALEDGFSSGALPR